MAKSEAKWTLDLAKKIGIETKVIEESINARVRTTANLNIRTAAGTGNPEISGGGYPGFAPSGSIGTVKEGPISSDGFVWWRIQFDAGYTGWGADNWLEGL